GRSGIANCHGESAGAAVAGGIGGLGCDRGSADSKDIAAVDLGLVGLAVIDIVFDGDLAGGVGGVAVCTRVTICRRVAGGTVQISGLSLVVGVPISGRSGIANCHGESAGAAVAGGIGGLGCDRGSADGKDIAAVDLGLVGLAVIDIVFDGDLVVGCAVVAGRGRIPDRKSVV